MNTAVVPLNETELTSKKLVPVIVTGVPTGPRVGANERMRGNTVNKFVLMITPPGVLTLIGPLRVSRAIVAVIVFEELTSKGTGIPPSVTLVSPKKFVPRIVT